MTSMGAKHAIVIGCGTYGAAAATVLFNLGYKTTVIDPNARSFSKLDAYFDGETFVGDGASCATLDKCGAKDAALMVCTASHDTTNMLAAEIATQIYGCPRVFACVKNEALAEVLEDFDVNVICPQHAFAKELCLQAGLNLEKAGLE